MQNPIRPNTKIRILSPEHSEYVQKLAFEAGFEWKESGKKVSYTEYSTLHFEENNHICAVMEYINKFDAYRFNQDPYEEIFIDLPSKNHAVHKPKHYEVLPEIEAIEIIASSMTCEQWRGYCLGNIMKYRLRAGKKDALQQDIDKANEYEMLYDKYLSSCKDS